MSEATQLALGFMGMIGLIGASWLGNRRRTGRIETRQIKIADAQEGMVENLRPSNGTTLAHTVEAIFQGQHQLGERMDQVRLDVNQHADEMRYLHKIHLDTYRHDRRIIDEG